MIYTKLTLHLYKRLQFLTGLKTITINFKERVHLFLGTNGSGKSSIMDEISVLPSNKDQFELGGYKQIWFTHQNVDYLSISDFTDVPKYSLIDLTNNVTLLDQGKLTQLKDICKMQFSITPKLEQLQSGYRFTLASVNDRREMLKLITEDKLKIGFETYQKLQAREKHLISIQKYLLDIKVKEEKLLLTKTELLEIDKLINDIEIELKDIINNKEKVLYSELELNNKLNNILLELNKIKIEYNKNNSLIDSFKYNKLTELELNIGLINENIVKLSTIIDIQSKELMDQQNIVNRLSSIGDQSSHDTDNLTWLANRVSELKDQLANPYIKFTSDPITTIYIVNDLKTILSTLPDTNIKQHQELEEELRISLKQLYIDREQFKLDYNQVKKAIDLLEVDNLLEVQCPKCNAAYKLNLRLNEINKYSQQLVNIDETLAKLTKEINDKEKQQEEMSMTSSIIHSLNEFVKEHSLLYPLLNKLKQDGYFSDKRGILQVLDKVLNDLSVELDYKNTLKDYQANLDRVNIIKELSGINLNEANIKLTKINDEFIDNNNRLKILKDELNQLKLNENILNNLIKTKTIIDDLSNKEKEYRELLVKVIYQKELDTRYKQLTSQLTLISDERNSQHKLQERLIMNDNELNATETELLDITILLKELSPKSGLLANYMKLFYNSVIEEVNEFIEEMASYPMYLLPIDSTDDGLVMNYQFKVMVQDNGPIEDIKLCSGGQREMIDLAFRLVLMRKLNITDYPLYLDEFGHAMDLSHRAAAYKLIRDKLIVNDFTQAFIATHHPDVASTFITDTTILCDKNIELSSLVKPNEVTELIY